MKKIITIIIVIFLGFIFSAYSQNITDKRFTILLNTEPGAYKDGLNFGADIDYQMSAVYIKAGVFLFPDLNSASYFDTTVSLGGNIHLLDDSVRIYAGINAGTIYRKSYPYPFWGQEAGLQYYFPNSKLFIGIEYSRTLRTDMEFWGVDEKIIWRNNTQASIGVQL